MTSEVCITGLGLSVKHTKIEVLDHGYVRYIDHMGRDLSIVRNARVSHDADWRAGRESGSDNRLIHYLYTNKHNTPFESAVLTVEAKAPIFVFRQWHRHRTQSYNEVSARYTELPSEWYVPSPDHIGGQSTSNHQQREWNDVPNVTASRLIDQSCKRQFETYKELLESGVPRELARGILPLNTYSRMFATANLHNWFNFIRERTNDGAQYEIKVYAEAILEIIKEIFPVATEAYLSSS